MGRYQDQWHDELDKITTSLDRLALDTDEEVQSVVLDRLRRPTDAFLRKKIWFFSSTGVEDRLNALIRTHKDKAVALLSCTHVLPRGTIRSLLTTPNELNFNLAVDASASRYVGLIATIHFINNNAVQKDEAKRAQALIRLLEHKSDTFLRYLRNFFNVNNDDSLYDVFPPGALDALLGRLCQRFAGQVEGFRERCDWASARRAVGELSHMFGKSPKLDALLNTSLRFVQAWSRWRPVQRRILSQEKLKPQHKAELLHMLVLNGPDFKHARHRTSLDALLFEARHQGADHIRNGRSMVWLNNDVNLDSRIFLEGIMNFPSGSHLSMDGAIDVFVFLCMQNHVTLNTLRILESAAASREPRVYKFLNEVFYLPTCHARTHALMHLLQMVHDNGNHLLLDRLNGPIRDIIQEDFNDMQIRLRDLMCLEKHRNPQPTAARVQAFGHCITHIPSLQLTLDPHNQMLLTTWPSSNEIDACFQLRVEVLDLGIETDLVDLVNRYCLIRLTGRGNLDMASRATVVALLWHWQTRAHVPRRALALSIVCDAKLKLPFHVQTECLIHIRDMDDEHLREINAIICGGTETACIHLTKVICSRRFLRHHQQGCWKDVLLWMMNRHDQISGFSNIDIKSWFEWLDHLRRIFDVRERVVAAPEHAVLENRLHFWSQVLETMYLDVLLRLETRSDMANFVKSCLHGWMYEALIIRDLTALSAAEGVEIDGPFLEATRTERGDLDEAAWEQLVLLVSRTTT